MVKRITLLTPWAKRCPREAIAPAPPGTQCLIIGIEPSAFPRDRETTMAQSFSRAEAKSLISQTKELARALQSAQTAPQVANNELKQSVDKYRRKSAAALLRTIPILERPDGAFDVIPYEHAYPGSMTLRDIQLTKGTGERFVIEEGTAYSISSCQTLALEGSRIKLDEDAQTPRASSIVSAAYRNYAAIALAATAQELLDSLQHSAQELVQQLENGTNAIKWVFTSKNQKQNLASIYDRLNDILSGPTGEQARQTLSALRQLESISDEDAWSWYAAHKSEAQQLIELAVPGASGNDIWPISSDQAITLRERALNLLASLSQDTETANRLSQAVIQAVNRNRSTKLIQSLQTIPVDELNREKRGLRISSLKNAGYADIASVYTATAYELMNVRGISEAAAHEAKREAQRIADQMHHETKIQLSADKRTTEANTIVTSVYALNRWNELTAQCEAARARIIEEMESLCNSLLPATKRVGWLFSSAETVADAKEAYDRLAVYLEQDACRQADEVTQRRNQLKSITPSTSEAWVAFSENPVPFFNTIEELVPDALGNNDTLYGLPEDLAREIQDECFFPEGLHCTLRRYQEWGVKYILHQGKTLLGDEMGLGKTVQAIAAMVSLRNTGETHFLVVCPASVLENWYREVKKFSALRVARVHGKTATSAFESWQTSGGVAVTTYETTAKLELNAAFEYGLAAIDEAHYIKNPATARSKNTLKLVRCAKRVVFMTGTAIENKVDEMITLIGNLRPDIAENVRPLSFMSHAKQFRDAIAPVYYRRKREDVLSELPDLIATEEWCTLGPTEKEAYERAILSKNFMTARRVSWNVSDMEESSKARRLLEIIEAAKQENRKVLIFTYFLDTARSVAEMMGARCIGVINGSVSPANRQVIVEQFDKAPAGSVLVAQIQSGGTGMNIQSASVVVFCEPQYKPSIENQAVSRAYRMGQTRNVLSFHLLCENTIDERILELLKKKQAIFDAFADKSSAAAAAAKEDIKIDDKTFGKLIEEEIERIKAENPDLAAQVAQEQTKMQAERSITTKPEGEQQTPGRVPRKTNHAVNDSSRADVSYAEMPQARQSSVSNDNTVAHRTGIRSSKAAGPSNEKLDWVAEELRHVGISIVDKRPQGGSLWAIGGLELNGIMQGLSESGALFNYAANGGKATGNHPGWWMKGYPTQKQ